MWNTGIPEWDSGAIPVALTIIIGALVFLPLQAPQATHITVTEYTLPLGWRVEKVTTIGFGGGR